MPKQTFVEDTHILLSEYACKHCGALPPGLRDLDGDIHIEYQVLFRAYEQIREKRGGVPLAVISGYRCEAHQQAEYDAWVLGGEKGAIHALFSVHLFGLALDLGAVSKVDQIGIVKLARELKPQPRIGWKQYQDAGIYTVHIDYGYLIEPIYSKDLVAGAEW
jgi:hypothetical protein